MRELLVRKTAGNVVELSSFLAVGWSPLWLLAGASDLVGGTKVVPAGAGRGVTGRGRACGATRRGVFRGAVDER